MRELLAPHQCEVCKIFLVRRPSVVHTGTNYCRDIAEKLEAQAREEHYQQEVTACQFTAGTMELKKVPSFLYLGRILTSNNSDVLAVRRNVQKAKGKWAMIRRILSCKPVKLTTYVRMYRAVVLSVLLYGCESWELLSQSLATLEAFHNRCVRTMVGEPIRCIFDEEDGDNAIWIRPPIQPLLDRTGLLSIQDYISAMRANHSASYQPTPIAERCATLTRAPVFRRRFVFGFSQPDPPPVSTDGSSGGSTLSQNDSEN